MQYAAEVHIVTLVAKGERPEWGCDDVWAGGDPVLENCTAVFGTLYKLGDTTPEYLKAIIDQTPVSAEKQRGYPGGSFNLAELLPASSAHYTYVGSLVRCAGRCDDGRVGGRAVGCVVRLRDGCVFMLAYLVPSANRI
jgi:Eukaryotic-type carbonic anhydrase